MAHVLAIEVALLKSIAKFAQDFLLLDGFNTFLYDLTIRHGADIR